MDQSHKQRQNPYIKTDDNRIINKTHIIWVKKISECLEICTKTDGCSVGINTHKICKLHNESSYNELNRHFD